jgi:hypothetical protein
MIDPQEIFKRLASDSEAERIVAAHKLYESFTKDGGHPDDWLLHKKGTKPPRDSHRERSRCDRLGGDVQGDRRGS